VHVHWGKINQIAVMVMIQIKGHDYCTVNCSVKALILAGTSRIWTESLKARKSQCNVAVPNFASI
jgi:hypothetical protein